MGTGGINEEGLLRENGSRLAWVLKFWMLDFDWNILLLVLSY